MINIEASMVGRLAERLTESDKPALLTGIGLPGSGRATLLNLVAKQLDLSVINADAMHAELENERQHGVSLTYFTHFVREKVAEQLNTSSHNIALLDDTNCFRSARIEDIEWYRGVGALTIAGLHIDIPLAEALAFDAKRLHPLGSDTMEHMHRSLVEFPPTVAEGFDWIERFSNHE